jgi:hypothetical protein
MSGSGRSRGRVLMRRLVAIATVAVTLSGLARAGARPPQPVYFWGSTAAAIAGPGGALSQDNVRVVRPSAILMFEDGSWDIEHLRWSGWGSNVARGVGISSASNGIPNQAQGKRIKSPAVVTLSHPGRFRGHEVYRCFALTVPAYPPSDEQLCLGGSGGYVYLQSTARHVDDFLSPDRRVWCAMSSAPLFCATGGAAADARSHAPQRLASLSAGGKVTTCFVAVPSVSAGCIQNWDDSAPVLRRGQVNEVAGFRCTSAANGITCIVLSGRGAGRGFLISSGAVRGVAP